MSAAAPVGLRGVLLLGVLASALALQWAVGTAVALSEAGGLEPARLLSAVDGLWLGMSAVVLLVLEPLPGGAAALGVGGRLAALLAPAAPLLLVAQLMQVAPVPRLLAGGAIFAVVLVTSTLIVALASRLAGSSRRRLLLWSWQVIAALVLWRLLLGDRPWPPG